MDAKRWSKGQDEKGFTISELLTVIALITISFGVFYSVFSFGLRTIQDTQRNIEAERDARQALSWLTYELRGVQNIEASAAVLDIANGNEVRFYLDTESAQGPLRVHYFLRGSELVRGTVRPDSPNPPWTYSGVEQENIVASYIRNSDQSPMFRYFDANGVEILPPIDEASRKAVKIIRINLISDVDPSRLPPPFSLDTEVQLRNQK